MQVLEVRDWNFLRVFQCICAEPSSDPGALQGPSTATVMLDNILHLLDITALCCVPLNSALVCLLPVCAKYSSAVWIFPGGYGCVYGPVNTIQFQTQRKKRSSSQKAHRYHGPGVF